MTDTIVGVATAAGEGGVAIVRMSGDEAAAIFEQAFRPRKRKPPFRTVSDCRKSSFLTRLLLEGTPPLEEMSRMRQRRCRLRLRKSCH